MSGFGGGGGGGGGGEFGSHRQGHESARDGGLSVRPASVSSPAQNDPHAHTTRTVGHADAMSQYMVGAMAGTYVSPLGRSAALPGTTRSLLRPTIAATRRPAHSTRWSPTVTAAAVVPTTAADGTPGMDIQLAFDPPWQRATVRCFSAPSSPAHGRGANHSETADVASVMTPRKATTPRGPLTPSLSKQGHRDTNGVKGGMRGGVSKGIGTEGIGLTKAMLAGVHGGGGCGSVVGESSVCSGNVGGMGMGGKTMTERAADVMKQVSDHAAHTHTHTHTHSHIDTLTLNLQLSF